MTWMWTGFAMVILSAALKGISPELLEAARVDGASEWQVFRGIVFPLLLPTIAVVSTTIVITALKAFDIVWVMTGGNFNTDVVASQMIKESFTVQRVRARQRTRRGPAHRDHPGHARQHQPVPSPGGDPMTAIQGAGTVTATSTKPCSTRAVEFVASPSTARSSC